MVGKLEMSRFCIGECPSNSPFLKNSGAEAPKGPRPIVFTEWRDTRTFSILKSTHCTLSILLIIKLKVNMLLFFKYNYFFKKKNSYKCVLWFI
jgi:hypothetical protein